MEKSQIKDESVAHPVDVYVGKKLRHKRTMLGLSQEAIGKAIGVTFQQIQKYERGINRMSSSRLFEFARILHVPVSFFFEGFDQGEEPKKKYANAGFSENTASKFEHEDISNRETLELMRAYYRISEPAVRKRVFELIKSLADQPEK